MAGQAAKVLNILKDVRRTRGFEVDDRGQRCEVTGPGGAIGYVYPRTDNPRNMDDVLAVLRGIGWTPERFKQQQKKDKQRRLAEDRARNAQLLARAADNGARPPAIAPPPFPTPPTDPPPEATLVAIHGCQFCSYSDANSRTVFSHQQKCSEGKLVYEGTFKCPMCVAVRTTIRDYERHLRRTHNQTGWMCRDVDCLEWFSSRPEQLAHQTKHTEADPEALAAAYAAIEGLEATGGDGEISMTPEVITPETALRYLYLNRTDADEGQRQRKVDEDLVKTFAASMKAKKWKLSPHGFGFDDEGKLFDGQHRCLAVLESGVPVPMWVGRGYPRDTIVVVDRGKKRTHADVLYMEGEANTFLLSSTLGLLTLWFNQVPQTQWGSLKVDPEDRLETLAEHPAIRDSVRRGSALQKKLGVVPSALAAAHYLMGHYWPKGPRDEYVTMLQKGSGLDDDHPAHQLREYLINHKDRRSKNNLRGHAKTVQHLYLLIHHYNLFCRGKRIKAVSLRPPYKIPVPYSPK